MNRPVSGHKLALPIATTLMLASSPALATGQEMAGLAVYLAAAVSLIGGLALGTVLVVILLLVTGLSGTLRQRPMRVAVASLAIMLASPVVVFMGFVLDATIQDMRKYPLKYAWLMDRKDPHAVQAEATPAPPQPPPDLATRARNRLGRIAQDLVIAWHRDPEVEEAELLATRENQARQQSMQDVYAATEATLRSAKPGGMAALIQRYEGRRESGIDQGLLLDRYLAQAPAATPEDLAALEAYIQRRGVMQGEQGPQLYARLVWGRDAAPGKLAALMDECRSASQGVPGPIEPRQLQFVCELSVFQWAQKEGPQRLCESGRYRDEDLRALQPAADDWARDEFHRGDWSRWIQAARAGCVASG